MTDATDGTARLKLLIADDGEIDRRSVRRALRAASVDAEVVEATDAAGALARLRETGFDAALLDYDLPGLDGPSIVRQARGANADTPIIVLTRHGDEETAVALMKAGAADYLPKRGLSADKLVQSLRHAQRVHRAEREAARAAAALERHAGQWHGLADAAVNMQSAETIDSVLATVTEHARRILDAHRATAEVRDGAGGASAAVSLSDRYAEHRSLLVPADPYGVGEAVTATSRPVRLTREEVAALTPASSREPERAPPDDDAAAEDSDELPAPQGWIAVPLLTRTGTNIGVLHVADRITGEFDARDETALVHLAQLGAAAIENLRLIDAARQAARAREQVLATVSHDLRNPLNTIAMAASLMLETQLPEQQVQRQLGAIRRAADTMDRMIQDLLDVTRMEAGRLSIEPGRLRAAELVAEAIELLAPIAAEHGLDLRVDADCPEADVHADRHRLIQVFSNLIGNAVKFTRAGGTITVSFEPLDCEVRFAVCDNGDGMDEDSLDRMFEPFWQAARGNGLGAGLGLPIAKGIVEAHGGRIWAESMPGNGSTFYFTIPTALESTEAAQQAD